jgi:type VI secretion system secreted protein Hcp
MVGLYAFIDLEGIEGEATDQDYKDKIEVQSVSWGGTNHSSFKHGTGGTISKGQMHEISFSKYMCKASLKLFERCVDGSHIPTGTLTLCKMSGDDNKIKYFEVELDKVYVTSYNVSAHGGGDLPMESITLSFVQAKTKYLPQKNEGYAAGNIGFGWDMQRNVKVS